MLDHDRVWRSVIRNVANASVTGSVCALFLARMRHRVVPAEQGVSAIRNGTLKSDHTHSAGAGVFPISGSCGQWLV